MSLADLVRDGVALADQLTGDGELQAAVTFEPWTGNDGYGGAQYGAAQSIDALIERTDRLVRDDKGNLVQAVSKISILRPIDPNGATGRREPIDPRDKFTLPDGTGGPIASVESFIDSATGRGYFYIVYLGDNA